jgi:TPR repeat protein
MNDRKKPGTSEIITARRGADGEWTWRIMATTSLALVVVTVAVCGCEPPSSPAASPVTTPTYRALVMGPTLGDDGIAATVTVRLAKGARPLARRDVALFYASSAGSSLPPHMIGRGRTDAAGALTISMASADLLLHVAGCTVMWKPPSSVASPCEHVVYGADACENARTFPMDAEVNTDTAMMALYLTSSPSEPHPIDPETMRPASGFVDCEVRLNQHAVAESMEAQRDARKQAMEEAAANAPPPPNPLEVAQREAEAQRRRQADQLARAQAEAEAAGPGGQAFARGDFKTACGVQYQDSCAILGLKNGCDSGDVEGCHKMGLLYWNGYGPIPSDKHRGLGFFDRACSLNPALCTDLGVVVMAGLPAQFATEPKIQSFFNRACSLDANTCARGCLAYEGMFVQQASIPPALPPEVRAQIKPFPADVFKLRKAYALGCYKRACSAGSGSACSLVTQGGTSNWLNVP